MVNICKWVNVFPGPPERGPTMAILAPIGGFNAHVSRDVRAVTAAASALQVPEFLLFKLAYARWFGREVSDAAMEPTFMKYLFTEEAPVWVRHFAREVLTLQDQGRLDRTGFGLPPRVRPSLAPDMVDRWGRLFLGLAWALIVVVIALAVL